MNQKYHEKKLLEFAAENAVGTKETAEGAENAIVEVAELSANNEVNIADLEAAVLELAEIIGG